MNEHIGTSKSYQSGNSDSKSASISDAFKQVKDAANSVCDAVGSVGITSAESAKATFEKGKSQAQEFGVKAEETLKARPLVAVGVAFAAGWLISRLVQSSKSQ